MKEEEELCQAFSEALLTVQDVDEDDEDQPQLCSQYVKDIYNYLRELEVRFPGLAPRRRGWRSNVAAGSAGAAGCAAQLHAGL